MKSVILTNEQGETLGTSEIIAAHTSGGLLHKAFSICILTPDNSKVLLQRRAEAKMLFPKLWANTCCSHPKEEAPIETEAAKRLLEECGFTTELTAIGSFTYKADDPSGAGTEYEYDTVLTGISDESTPLNPHPDEVMEMQWMNIDALRKDMRIHPENYAPWLHHVLNFII